MEWKVTMMDGMMPLAVAAHAASGDGDVRAVTLLSKKDSYL